MKKVSEWLSELGTHNILDCAAAKADFEKETGETPCWHDGYSKAEMQRMIDGRGKGGSLSGADDMKFIGTQDIAEACADKYVPQPWYHGKMGMGFAVRSCIEKISESGY